MVDSRIKEGNMEAKDTVMAKRLTEIFNRYATAFEVENQYNPAPWVQEVVNLIKDEIEISIKKVGDWLHSPCPHTGGLEEEQMYVEDCPKCWRAFKERLGK